MSRWFSRVDPRKSIRAKLVLNSVFLLSATATFFSVRYPNCLDRATVQELQGRATSVGRMVALGVGIGLASNDFSAVAEAIEWTKADSTLAYLAVQDPDGVVFASFAIDDVDIDQALAPHGRAKSAFQYATVPIRYRSESLGTLKIGFSRQALAPAWTTSSASPSPSIDCPMYFSVGHLAPRARERAKQSSTA